MQSKIQNKFQTKEAHKSLWWVNFFKIITIFLNLKKSVKFFTFDILAMLGQDCRIKIRNTGEFKCQQCSAKFTLKSYLSLHMKKHQLYTCETCKVEFNSQFSLKYHEFSHLDTEPKCSNCAKVFSSEQKFSIHLRKKLCMVNGLTNGHTENGISI